MAKSAILIDGGYLFEKMERLLERYPRAEEVYQFALKCFNDQEKVFRIFFYHCLPFEESRKHPITGETIDFKNSPIARHNRRFMRELSEKNFVAVRKGQLDFKGWKLSDFATKQLQDSSSSEQAAASQTSDTETSNPPLQMQQTSANVFENLDKHFKPDFKQKEVDIKIGLDVAWLSSKRIVDKIILVTGDQDLVPAMKFARREGVQVVLVRVDSGYIKGVLKEHADEVRQMMFDRVKSEWSIIR